MIVAWARNVQCGNAKQLVQSEESYCDNRLIAWADGTLTTVRVEYAYSLMEAHYGEPPQ